MVNSGELFGLVLKLDVKLDGGIRTGRVNYAFNGQSDLVYA